MGPSIKVSFIFLTFIIIYLTLSHADNLTTNPQLPENPSSSSNISDIGKVTIYTGSNFWGIPWVLHITNCTDVPGFFYRKASSIDTHDNCVILFGREECQGIHVRIAPGTDGHSHLSAVNFDDNLVSLMPCDDFMNEANKTKGHRKNRREVQFFDEFIDKLKRRSDTDGDADTDSNDSEDNEDDNDSEEKGDGEMNLLQSLLSNIRRNPSGESEST